MEGEIPLPDTAEEAGLSSASAESDEPDEPDEPAEVAPEDASQGPAPAWPELWVERRSFAIRGIDFADGVRIRLGPEATFSGVRVPSWIYIQEPGHEAVQLHVLGVSVEAHDPGAFDPQWLFSASDPPREDSIPLVPAFPPPPSGPPGQ